MSNNAVEDFSSDNDVIEGIERSIKTDKAIEKKKDPKGSLIALVVVILGAALVAILLILANGNSIAATGQLVSETSSSQFYNIYESLKYEKSIHILAMLLVGFGFLMVFVRKHGFSSITATFLVVSVALPLYMVIRSFGGEFQISITSIDSFILAEFAAASLLIAIGAPLGRLKMDQYLAMAVLFIPAYILNEWLILESGYFPGFVDAGGSVVIHAFGAYFGLGVISNTLAKFKDEPQCEANSTSNQFCLIGSMMLWIFWPSFTSALVAPELVPLTAINTVFALCGATLATYVFSRIIRGKIEIEDIANAALAGGVAIGSVCNLTSPGFAILIGLVAGTLSTVGYAIIAPKVEKLIKGTDTCGVHNLHGMPGILGGLSGMFFANSPGVQFTGILITVIIAFSLGKVAGVLIRLMGQKEIAYSDDDEFLTDH
ncbi:MAG: ammonium transporter [Eubacteriales bacterium]